MALVTKATEKFNSVLKSLSDNYSEEQFVEKFKEMYEKDWMKIVRRYEEHEKRSIKQKRGHPMPKPEKYVLNISHKIRNSN